MIRPIRVLVVEDSASVRRLLAELFATSADVRLAAEAGDGQEALKLAVELAPDLVLLDLEMPKMDGFTFLRFFRARSQAPVVVLSRHSGRRDVRRALDLGASAFVAKPQLSAGVASPEALALLDRIRSLCAGTTAPSPSSDAPRRRSPAPPARVVLVGASTGGPGAVQRLVSALPGGLPLCVLVAQHMPARFTPAFAERLDRSSAFSVAEARGGERLLPGTCLISPGGKSVELVVEAGEAVVRLRAAEPPLRYAPSIDLLFGSAALALGPHALGIVLTGMGEDGREGLRALHRAGARTIAEAQASAVVFGMPKAAIEAGGAQEVLCLPDIVEAVMRYGREAMR